MSNETAGQGPVDQTVGPRKSPKSRAVTNYWLNYYHSGCCTLCGNRGWLNTTGTKTLAGVLVGRVNYCICPNGQSLRSTGTRTPDTSAPVT